MADRLHKSNNFERSQAILAPFQRDPRIPRDTSQEGSNFANCCDTSSINSGIFAKCDTTSSVDSSIRFAVPKKDRAGDVLRNL
jgi:hypothetical protein